MLKPTSGRAGLGGLEVAGLFAGWTGTTAGGRTSDALLAGLSGWIWMCPAIGVAGEGCGKGAAGCSSRTGASGGAASGREGRAGKVLVFQVVSCGNVIEGVARESGKTTG